MARICAISSPTVVAWPVSSDGRPESPDSDYVAQRDKMRDEMHDDEQCLSKESRICLGTDFLIAVVPPEVKIGDVIVRF